MWTPLCSRPFEKISFVVLNEASTIQPNAKAKNATQRIRGR